MDIHDVLIFEDRFIDYNSPSGLWFCDNALDAYAVSVNAVCLADGFDHIGEFQDWFAKFRFIFIASPDRARRRVAESELRSRLPYIPILSARETAFCGCKSVSALKDKYGIESVELLLCGAEELPAYGLINISSVTPLDLTKLKRSTSGIKQLDMATGGFLFGDVTIWSGKRGEGKSTVMGQCLLHARDQGQKVCLYSGELRKERCKEWLYLQAAGPNNVVEQKDPTGRVWYTVPNNIRREIDEWLDGQLFLYDISIASAHDEDKILSIFEYAARRYGCTVFAIDNLMTANFKRMKDSDYYRAQSQFVGRCEAFAKALNVHVHIVAHPKKKEEVSDGDDISGSGDIANRADNVITIQRLSETQVQQNGYDSGLSLIKNRWFGDRAKIALKFEPKSRRFYQHNGGRPDWRYGWEKISQAKIYDLEEDL
jgi:twinkle protein